MIEVYILAVILGLCIGSFLNVVIYRLPLGMSLAKPSSHCTKCNYSLKWYDNIPVLSYIFLGGKCRKCKTRISPRYISVELFNALLYALSVFLFWEQSMVYAITVALLSSVLICVFFIDLEHTYIPDRFQLIIFALGIVAMFFNGYTPWYDHLIGGFAGGLVFLAIYFLAIAVYKREGLGFGDVKLSFVIGLFLGWQRFILAMLIASLSACFILIPIKYIKKTDEKTEFPFAPFITFGTLVAVFFGAQILTWYIALLTL